jgi:uncharacterized membrane protein YkoI
MRMILTLLAAACLLGPLPGASAHDNDKRCKRDQDCALEAVNKGEIRPLAEVLAVIRRLSPGQIASVELERDDGMWIYKVKILAPDGRRRKAEVDAKTLAVLKLKAD